MRGSPQVVQARDSGSSTTGREGHDVAAGTTSGPAGRSPSRYAGLDGLRGIAALVVVVFHTLLLSPVFNGLEPGTRPHDASWWVTHTPLSLLWAGPQAVYVFFVLSGFVLVLPVAGRGVRWRSYYPQRLLRLYLPVWASLVLALVLVAVVPRTPQPSLSGWYDAHVPASGPAQAVHDAVLLLGTGWLNSPLWSLRWEVTFSLLLPLYVLGARLLRRLWAVKLGTLLVVVGAAEALGMYAPMYLSMFALGAVLALDHDRVVAAGRAVLRRVPARLPGRWGVVTAGAALLLTTESLLLAAGLESSAAQGAAVSLQLLGACAAVLVATHSAGAVRLLSARTVQWVALRSFSLYLVHEPLVVTSATLWPSMPIALRVVLALVVSLLAADLFFRAVERPAHVLARRVGTLAGGRPGRHAGARRGVRGW